ncbi:MAG: hypothetical protein ACTHKH_11175 [Trinickia sp.]
MADLMGGLASAGFGGARALRWMLEFQPMIGRGLERFFGPRPYPVNSQPASAPAHGSLDMPPQGAMPHAFGAQPAPSEPQAFPGTPPEQGMPPEWGMPPASSARASAGSTNSTSHARRPAAPPNEASSQQLSRPTQPTQSSPASASAQASGRGSPAPAPLRTQIEGWIDSAVPILRKPLPTPPRVIDQATLERGRAILESYKSELIGAMHNLNALKAEVSGIFAKAGSKVPPEIEAKFNARKLELNQYQVNLMTLVSDAEALHEALKPDAE